MAADYDQLFLPPEEPEQPEEPQHNGYDVTPSSDASGPSPSRTPDRQAIRPMPIAGRTSAVPEPPKPAETGSTEEGSGGESRPPKPAAPRPPEPPAQRQPHPQAAPRRAPQPPEGGRHARHRNDAKPPRPNADGAGPNARTTPLRRARNRYRAKTERIPQATQFDDAAQARDGLQRHGLTDETQTASAPSSSLPEDRRAPRRSAENDDAPSAVKPAPTRTLPRRGWRRWVRTLTRINLGPSPDEKYETSLRTRIRRNPRGSYQVAVVGLKGGAGRTAVTATLGSVFAEARGDRILVVDADGGSGDLADRVGRQSDATIADLLTDHRVAHYNDVRAFTSINTVNLEVLAGQDYSQAKRALNDRDWYAAVETLSRFYNLVVADCGNTLFDSATTGVLSTVSGVVVVASASVDGARQAEVTLDWLHHNGYRELLDRSCVVINQVVPGKPAVDVSGLARRFEERVKPGRVFVLPFDKHIAGGGDISFDVVGSTYKRRLLEVAAALSDDFDRTLVR